MNDEAIELTADEAIERLVGFQTYRDPCENGHVEHVEADHLDRRVIHSISPKGFGADWDEEEVHEFVRRATRIVDLRRRSHPIAVFSDDGDGQRRWMRFETSDPPEQADGMTAAKARDDLERGTAHFDREFVDWRGTEVEVVD